MNSNIQYFFNQKQSPKGTAQTESGYSKEIILHNLNESRHWCALVFLLSVHALAVGLQDAAPCMQKGAMQDLDALTSREVSTVATIITLELAWLHMLALLLCVPATQHAC
jgi:hypothetical protein